VSDRHLYCHLQIKTEYSLSRGALFYKEAVKLAKKHNMPHLAICDDSNLFGSYEFAKECTSNKIKPIIGCCLKLKHYECEGIINIYAKNEEGLKNLFYLSSILSLDGSLNNVLTFEIIKNHQDGLIVLSGGAKGVLGGLILRGDNNSASKFCDDFAEVFADRFYIEITRHGTKDEFATEQKMLELVSQKNIAACAGHRVYFANPEDYEAQDVLMCIGEGRYIVEQDRPKVSAQEFFKSTQQIADKFADLPQLLENTANIALRCNVFPKGRKPMLPPFKSENGSDESTELARQASEGLKQRLQNSGIAAGFTEQNYIDRLQFELEVINKMGFAGYFLIVSDFIKWSKANDVPVGPGRGSGAGSIVAWVLYITDLDPLYYGLLFERFLNPERVSMPDFDIDFCQERRHLVIDYVKQKYGEASVASIITFGKLQARAALKDVGRVLQLPYGQVDAICKMVPFNPIEPVTLQKAIDMDPALREQMEMDSNIKKLVSIALKLEGLNRHSSTHAAGVIIGDKQLVEIVPLYRASDEDMQAVGYNMKAAESVGLVKFDFLGLKTLTVIANTIKLARQHYGVEINMSKIPMMDEKTFKMLQDGFTRGIFQLDSIVCKNAMKQMHIDAIEDIIALTSLNRPGPMENIPSYINRKIGKEQVEYPHKSLEKVLGETYGVIIYQEQVMQVAQVLSGYSLGQADLLRRAMGKKIKEEMDAQRAIFVEGAAKNGVDNKKAEEIFDLVEKFAGYGFNKSHAAAYSVISYQTAYLKAHFPLCFFAASLNMDIDDTDSMGIFVNEAREMGFEIVLPCVLKSDAMFSIKDDKIHYALSALKAVGGGAMKDLEEIRAANGSSFKDIFDFCQKAGPKIANKRAVESLAKSGAFDKIHPNRRQIVENVETLVAFATSQKREQDSGLESLFGGGDEGEGGGNSNLAMLTKVSEYESMEKLGAEFEAVGFYMSSHPLQSYKQKLDEFGVIWAGDIEKLGIIPREREKTIKMAGVVTIVRQRSGKKGRFAFVHLADLQKVFECTIFNSDLITNKRDLIKEGQIVGLHVSVQRPTEEETARLNIRDIFSIDDFFKQAPPKDNSFRGFKPQTPQPPANANARPPAKPLSVATQFDKNTGEALKPTTAMPKAETLKMASVPKAKAKRTLPPFHCNFYGRASKNVFNGAGIHNNTNNNSTKIINLNGKTPAQVIAFIMEQNQTQPQGQTFVSYNGKMLKV